MKDHFLEQQNMFCIKFPKLRRELIFRQIKRLLFERLPKYLETIVDCETAVLEVELGDFFVVAFQNNFFPLLLLRFIFRFRRGRKALMNGHPDSSSHWETF